MTELDPRVGELLRAVVPRAGAEAPDWDDVLRRAARTRKHHGTDRGRLPFRSRRTWYALAAAALLTVLGVSPAFGIVF